MEEFEKGRGKMELRVCASGSQANGYAVMDGKEALLIEAGCKYRDALEMLDYNTMQICGMVISHEHGDHYKYIDQYRNRGFPILEPFVDGTRLVLFGSRPTFSAQAFAVPHQEDIQCFGYLIKHREIGRLLFMTDLEYCPYDLSDVKPDTVMVECNYMDEYVDASLLIEQKQRTDHKYSGHMSLKTCKTFLETVWSENLKHVILLHMSFETCDPNEAVRQVTEVVGENVTVDVAQHGLVVDITR